MCFQDICQQIHPEEHRECFTSSLTGVFPLELISLPHLFISGALVLPCLQFYYLIEIDVPVALS